MITVKSAYTTKELAELLGITVRAVNLRGVAESWISRPRPGRGGGNEWLLESMPEGTRQTIAAAIVSRIAHQQAPALARISTEVFTVNTLSNVPEKRRERASARALLVSMAREFSAASGTARSAAYEVFCHEYNRRAIPAPAWVRELLPRVCRASLCNWEAAIGTEGLAALAGRQGQHRKGKGVIDATPGMADVVIAHIIKFYDEIAEEVMDALEETHKGQPLPSLRNLQRWMKRYRAEHPRTLLQAQNPDGFRSQHQVAFGSRSEGVTEINQLWEMDSSPADVLLADGKRYTVLGCIDVGSRRGRLKLAKTSSGQGVCSLLRCSLLDFGVPGTIKIDNGADYTGFRVTTAIHDLGIHPEYCKPFSPEEKPHIERFFGTFQRRLKKLPGFIGHSVADRKAIESQKSFAERVSRKSGETREKPLWELPFTPDEFQKYCDDWCANVYGERKHSTLKISPNEAAAQAAAQGVTQRIADERALDILLMPIPGNEGVRTVHKDGILAENGKYIAPALGGMIGDEAQVRLDEDNAGYIYVFDLDGIFICRAEDPDLTGVSRREIAMAATQVQKAVEGAKAKEVKRIVAKVKPQELIPLIMETKNRQAAENRAERELRFGAERSREYTTPALKQAAIAARAATGQPPASALTEEQREAETARARAILAEEKPWSIPASDAERYSECLRLMGLEIVGGNAPFEAFNWMRVWQNSRVFKNFEAVRLAGERAGIKNTKG